MSNNVFEKIEHQGNAIDQIATKLEGISIQDLYALAKRTWDYKDYEMAQKYYNHISLLNPLDWEAPFYASLCGEMGRDAIVEWQEKPRIVFGYYKSTVNYLLERDITSEEKVTAITSASDIFLDVLQRYEDVYSFPENKTRFDKYAPRFQSEIYKAYFNVAKFLSELTIFSFDELVEKFNAKSNLHLEDNVFESLDANTEKQIRLHGICYLQHIDKIVEKRYKAKSFILGSILLIIGLCIMLFFKRNSGFDYSLILEVPVIIYSLIMILRVLLMKNGIRRDSFLNSQRKKERETSNGDIVEEERFAPVRLFEVFLPYFASFGGMYYVIFSLSEWKNAWLGIVLFVIQTIIVFYSTVSFKMLPHQHSTVKQYKYKGKFYRL